MAREKSQLISTGNEEGMAHCCDRPEDTATVGLHPLSANCALTVKAILAGLSKGRRHCTLSMRSAAVEKP